MSETPSGTGRLVATLFAFSGLVLLAAATAAWKGWLPYDPAFMLLVAKVFLGVAMLDFLLAFVFLRRAKR